MATVAAKQAAIVAALYSARLTMIVTVYTNEIVFWDSDEGMQLIACSNTNTQTTTHILSHALSHALISVLCSPLPFTLTTLLYHCLTLSHTYSDLSSFFPLSHSPCHLLGTIVKRIEAEDLGRTDAAVDITSAVLDDRERKVVTGDSSGVVSVYNCATAVKIKSFPPIPTSVQYVMYTPDKTILVVGTNGGLYVYDDRLTDVKEDYLLRDTRTHEADIVACSYSYTLGLIATADSEDTVGLTPSLLFISTYLLHFSPTYSLPPSLLSFLLSHYPLPHFSFFPSSPCLVGDGMELPISLRRSHH